MEGCASRRRVRAGAVPCGLPWAQGLDAAGIDAYVSHLRALFVHPLLLHAAAAGPAADAGSARKKGGRKRARPSEASGPGAVGNAGADERGEGADGGGGGKDEAGSGRAAGPAPAEATRRWAVEQLCGAAALPGAAARVRGATARWLAAAGMLELEAAPRAKARSRLPGPAWASAHRPWTEQTGLTFQAASVPA